MITELSTSKNIFYFNYYVFNFRIIFFYWNNLGSSNFFFNRRFNRERGGRWLHRESGCKFRQRIVSWTIFYQLRQFVKTFFITIRFIVHFCGANDWDKEFNLMAGLSGAQTSKSLASWALPALTWTPLSGWSRTSRRSTRRERQKKKKRQIWLSKTWLSLISQKDIQNSR